MKIYYTNAFKGNEPQNEAVNSLGGYVSNSEVPNDLMGNLFSSISPNFIEKNYREIKGIILKNDEGIKITDVLLYFTVLEAIICKYRIAAVALAEDDCGKYMEKLENSRALPYSATFYEADGVGNAINVGDLEIGGMIGLWVERTIKEGESETDWDALYDLFTAGTKLEVKESATLTVDWTVP